MVNGVVADLKELGKIVKSISKKAFDVFHILSRQIIVSSINFFWRVEKMFKNWFRDCLLI